MKTLVAQRLPIPLKNFIHNPIHIKMKAQAKMSSRGHVFQPTRVRKGPKAIQDLHPSAAAPARTQTNTLSSIRAVKKRQH